MSEVCHDVSTEPLLQPLSCELLSLKSCNWDVGVRLDMRPLDFGVVGFNLLFLIWEYLILMPLQTLTISVNVWSAVSMKRGFIKLNIQVIVPYCHVMSWLCCCLGISILHSAIMCIRGSYSFSGLSLMFQPLLTWDGLELHKSLILWYLGSLCSSVAVGLDETVL